MTADIRAAARAQAGTHYIAGETDDEYTVSQEVAAFIYGAEFGADRVTPTHDQIAMTVAQFFGPRDTPEDVATAVLKLMAGLAEGESGE